MCVITSPWLFFHLNWSYSMLYVFEEANHSVYRDQQLAISLWKTYLINWAYRTSESQPLASALQWERADWQTCLPVAWDQVTDRNLLNIVRRVLNTSIGSLSILWQCTKKKMPQCFLITLYRLLHMETTHSDLSCFISNLKTWLPAEAWGKQIQKYPE